VGNLAVEKSKVAQGLMPAVADDDVVADLDFHQLSRANQFRATLMSASEGVGSPDDCVPCVPGRAGVARRAPDPFPSKGLRRKIAIDALLFVLCGVFYTP